MGKLFWKFFIFIWLGQLVAVFGTGALFWYERQSAEAAGLAAGQPHRPPPDFAGRRPPPAAHGADGGPRPPPPEAHGPEGAHRPPSLAVRGAGDDRPPPPHRGGRGPGGGLPVLPLFAGFLASLLCAAGMAWYFARPIRHLRDALAGAGGGDLAVRVGPAMGGRRDELADLGRDFDAMAERLQALVAGQQRLLHDVSHEMRSPLARLQAAIGLLRQQPGRLDDSLARIEREGERMNRLVGELLTLSRLEAGVGGPLEVVDMDELLAAIVDDARFEGEARQLRIELAGAPGGRSGPTRPCCSGPSRTCCATRCAIRRWAASFGSRPAARRRAAIAWPSRTRGRACPRPSGRRFSRPSTAARAIPAATATAWGWPSPAG